MRVAGRRDFFVERKALQWRGARGGTGRMLRWAEGEMQSVDEAARELESLGTATDIVVLGKRNLTVVPAQLTRFENLQG